MKELSIDQINCHAPYDVCSDRDGAILFRTDYGVEYSVTFDEEIAMFNDNKPQE